jgi:glycosyltransferase involved in cell wall biosynthesis
MWAAQEIWQSRISITLNTESNRNMIRICLIAAFPPSIRPLNEYSFHLAREIQRHKDVELVILADELEDYTFATDAEGNPADAEQSSQLPGVTVIRCWKFGSLATPVRLLNKIRQLKPDVVWFNLVFSTFGSPDSPLAAFAGLSVPALTRAAGFYTHITLHNITEHVDLAGAGVRHERLYRKGTDVATRILLKAHSVSVLLSDYRRTLRTKYSAENIIVGTHGTFTTISMPPDLTKRGNPDLRILAFGNWGTYKRLERLMEAFSTILERIPNARLIVAGGNHPAAAGYWESVREMQPPDLPIEFLGYIPQKDVPKLFCTSSLLVMPYDSSTGSSGPAHQACEYGVPIVCADIPDFRCMAADDDMAIMFYKAGDAADLAEKLLSVLESSELQRQMSEHNYQAGVQMTMATVVRNYLRWFQLHKVKRSIAGKGTVARLRRLWFDSWWSSPFDEESTESCQLDPNSPSKGADDDASEKGVGSANIEIPSSGPVKSPSLRNLRTGTEHIDSECYDRNPELEQTR